MKNLIFFTQLQFSTAYSLKLLLHLDFKINSKFLKIFCNPQFSPLSFVKTHIYEETNNYHPLRFFRDKNLLEFCHINCGLRQPAGVRRTHTPTYICIHGSRSRKHATISRIYTCIRRHACIASPTRVYRNTNEKA